MNNVFVYCEIEGTTVAEVSQELLTKGRKLADELGVQLHAVVAGTGIRGQVEDQILPYGVIGTAHRHHGEPLQRGATPDLPDGRHRHRP